MEKIKALVLLSGGQDSATCLAVALKDFPDQVVAVFFDYGQRHKIERESARKIASCAKVPLEIIDLSILNKLTSNALTRGNIKIQSNKYSFPSTFVPGRNHIFLSFAAVYAYERKITNIYSGVCQTDYSGYPDCRENFINSLENTLNLGMDFNFKLATPLMHLKKSETVLLMKKLDKLDWYKLSYTCYQGDKISCGKCPACKLRLKGFEEAGIKDPLIYK